MPIPDEYSEICDMLLEATKEGRVNWIDSGGSFVVRLPQFDFEIWSGTDDDDSHFVAVGLKDPTGHGLLDTWFVEGNNSDFRKLDELCSAARRHAYGVNQKLQQMRDLLKSGQMIGLEKKPPKTGMNPQQHCIRYRISNHENRGTSDFLCFQGICRGFGSANRNSMRQSFIH